MIEENFPETKSLEIEKFHRVTSTLNGEKTKTEKKHPTPRQSFQNGGNTSIKQTTYTHKHTHTHILPTKD